jgi:uncharacterized protein YjbI with pentapeptide repeats
MKNIRDLEDEIVYQNFEDSEFYQRYTKFEECTFKDCVFNRDVTLARFKNCTFTRCTFHCNKSEFKESNFEHCTFRDVHEPQFDNCTFSDVVLEGYIESIGINDCTLQKVKIQRAFLTDFLLKRSSMEGIQMEYSKATIMLKDSEIKNVEKTYAELITKVL